MNKYPKRLIEVDLPIKRISAHSRKDKNVRKGHLQNMHVWWARRPLAACRAVTCAALWPDPADELCPQAFIDKARELMFQWSKEHLAETVCQESQNRFVMYQSNPEKLDDLVELRMALLEFIADFSAWESSTNKTYLETSRALTQSAHEALGGLPGTRPLVVDPFAGGGAIPLEALRVGADTFASDLNPVAYLLNLVSQQYVPSYGENLAVEVEKYSNVLLRNVKQNLEKFYPKDNNGNMPLAYIWARTINCEGPNCGTRVPLLGMMQLSRKKGRNVVLEYRTRPKTSVVRFIGRAFAG